MAVQEENSTNNNIGGQFLPLETNYTQRGYFTDPFIDTFFSRIRNIQLIFNTVLTTEKGMHNDIVTSYVSVLAWKHARTRANRNAFIHFTPPTRNVD